MLVVLAGWLHTPLGHINGHGRECVGTDRTMEMENLSRLIVDVTVVN